MDGKIFIYIIILNRRGKKKIINRKKRNTL